MEAEYKLMNSNKYAVRMKEVGGEMQSEHEQMTRYLQQVESASFVEWDKIREVSNRNIASLLRRIHEKLVKAFHGKLVRQMRTAVSYDIHSRLLGDFWDCYYSL